MSNDNAKDKDSQDKAAPKQKQARTMFSKNIIIPFEGGGEIHLRRPTTKELNAFDKQTTPTNRKGLKVDAADPHGARVALFDNIFIKALNFEDETGPMPEDALDRIPDDDKSFIVLHHVQVKENINVKN